MSNGIAACLPLPEPPPAQPLAAEAPGATAIGAAMAAAVAALAAAGVELQEGGRITATTRRAGAERIYRLHQLRQGNPGIDFTAIAHRDGMRILQQYLAELPPGAGTGRWTA